MTPGRRAALSNAAADAGTSKIGSMSAEDVRSAVGHPIIDADGHTIEFLPALYDEIRRLAGPSVLEGVRREIAACEFGYDETHNVGWHSASADERRDRRLRRGSWWGFPTKNTLDRATASLPALLYSRMDELGLDMSVLYPTWGPTFLHMVKDEENRTAACRGLNQYQAAAYAEFADRLVPAAVVPMNSPAEAIAALDHAVVELGMKTVLIPSFVSRPIPYAEREHARLGRAVAWLDTFGLDSQYDYDPFWNRCVELDVSLAAHSPAFGPAWGDRRSISNAVFNHLGCFSAAHHLLARSLVLGGVTRRFAEIRIGFMEGGVSWAAQLYCDLAEHWEKRNLGALENYNPQNLRRDQFEALLEKFGRGILHRLGASPVDALAQFLHSSRTDMETLEGDAALLDEWLHCDIAAGKDLQQLFQQPFYFGCESDDRQMASGFDHSRLPFGGTLNVLFGSDIGHWDVPDMRMVVPEFYDQVLEGRLTHEQFCQVAYTTPLAFYGGSSGRFFTGTIVDPGAR